MNSTGPTLIEPDPVRMVNSLDGFTIGIDLGRKEPSKTIFAIFSPRGELLETGEWEQIDALLSKGEFSAPDRRENPFDHGGSPVQLFMEYQASRSSGRVSRQQVQRLVGSQSIEIGLPCGCYAWRNRRRVNGHHRPGGRRAGGMR